MKYIFNLMMCFSLLTIVASCSEDDNVPVASLEVNKATLNGTWKLTEWSGNVVNEDDWYVYVTFERAEQTFVMYSNVGSMYSHKWTGTFSISQDFERGTILTGIYDYDQGEMAEYIVTDMTENSMKWTRKDDASDVSVYTRCAEVPEDIQNGSRSAAF